MNLESLLISHGHEVSVFSMSYEDNYDSIWKEYWPSPMTSFKAFTRPFGDSEVVRKFTKLCDDFNPDVVHLNNIHTQLSPVIAEIANKRGIKVFWTLHDTKLVCPCYTCMREGKWCTECLTNKTSVIKHRCMPGSIPGAIIGYLEILKWNKERIQRCIEKFLPPSQFMKDTCVSGGYDSDKFAVMCNFIDKGKVKDPSYEKEDYYVFLGRLTKVKGIKTLCIASDSLPYKLVVIGGGELEDELRTNHKKIVFVGQKNWDGLRPILEKARFMVIPSEWSENNPLTVLESLSLGTPVLGARIGGIPELIEEGVNGMTFRSGDVDDLRDKIKLMWHSTFDYRSISEIAQEKYNSETYYEKLMKIYKGE